MGEQKAQNESQDKLRNVWAEVRAKDDENKRKRVEAGGRIVYTCFIVIGVILAFDLYTRPEAQLVKVFGAAAAILLMVSDIFWAWATHHSAAGAQRYIAYTFWSAGILIFAFNVISEYEHYLNVQMSDAVYFWYWYASVVTVVVAAVGWALYLMTSPEQSLSDVAAQAKKDAVQALLEGIRHPDADTSKAMNEQIMAASRDLAQYAGSVVRGHVSGLTPADDQKNGNKQHSTTTTPRADTDPNA